MARASEFASDNAKSLLILLKVKPGTEISMLQRGEKVLDKTFTEESVIIKQPEQAGIEAVGLQRITGVSSLLGELQTRKLFQRFGANKGGGKNQ